AAESAALMKHVTRRNGLHVTPVVVASDQPSESDLRVVEQELFPVVAHSLVLDAADHEPDDHLLHAFKLADRSDRNNQRSLRRLKRLHELEPALAHVEQRAAIRTGDPKRLIRRAQLERPSALRAVELSRSNPPRFAFTRDRNRETEFRESHFTADKHQRCSLAVIERGKDSVRPRQVGIFVLGARSQFVRYLALRSKLGCYALFGDSQWHRSRQRRYGLAQLDR